MKQLLPIGSVVIRRHTPNCVIICGCCYRDAQTGDAYDYIVAPWPQGMEQQSVLTYCQHEDILKILSFGYFTQEELDIRESGIYEMEAALNKK